MKHIYYYTNPCPECGSRKTGRYVRKPLFDSDYMFRESLKNGEFIEFVENVPYENTFCCDCDATWHQSSFIRRLTDIEIMQEKKERCLDIYYKEYLEENEKPKKSFLIKIRKGLLGH